MEIAVTGLATTAVKGMRLGPVDWIELDQLGARGNRAFYVIDERGRMLNGKQLGLLQTIVADYDRNALTLALSFPDGERAVAVLEYGDTLATKFFSLDYAARELRGPWSEALSSFAGRSLRLVAPEIALDRGRAGSTSLISRASVRRLAEIAQRDEIDARRFRMLIEIDGVAAHEEDDWVERRVRVGTATLHMRGHVGRCLVTSRDPESGEVDLPTLDLLGSYRREIASTEPLPFGIYGEVLEGGTVRVGDLITLAG
ncbi:MAG: MOSC domain-containing protein [Solirubrobacteraceae bacterium]